jgi:hypothetical protein
MKASKEVEHFTFMAKVITSYRITIPTAIVEQWHLAEGSHIKLTIEFGSEHAEVIAQLLAGNRITIPKVLVDEWCLVEGRGTKVKVTVVR